MKEVRSFSLDEVVAAAVDDLPKNERSRKINKILRKELLQERQTEEADISQIKHLIQSMINNTSDTGVGERGQNEQVKSALSNIIGGRS